MFRSLLGKIQQMILAVPPKPLNLLEISMAFVLLEISIMKTLGKFLVSLSVLLAFSGVLRAEPNYCGKVRASYDLSLYNMALGEGSDLQLNYFLAMNGAVTSFGDLDNGKAACEEALENANQNDDIRKLLESVKSACQIPFPDKPLPTIKCCSILSGQCSQPGSGDKCGSYKDHNICICYDFDGPVCKPYNDVKETLWEELFHALQECLKLTPVKENPYRKLPYKPVELVVPAYTPGTVTRCGGSADDMKWCKELGAKCNNPFNNDSPPKDTPPEQMKPFCEDFCDAYEGSDDTIARRCCMKTCQEKYATCCNWVPWPLPEPLFPGALAPVTPGNPQSEVIIETYEPEEQIVSEPPSSSNEDEVVRDDEGSVSGPYYPEGGF